MRITFKLINEPNDHLNSAIWSVTETYKYSLDKDIEQDVNVPLLLSYLNHQETSITLLEIIRSHTDFEIGDSFTTNLFDDNIDNGMYFINNIIVHKKDGSSTKDIFSVDFISVQEDFIEYIDKQKSVSIQFTLGTPMELLCTLRSSENFDFLDLIKLTVMDTEVAQSDLPESIPLIEQYIDNPFLSLLARKKETEIKNKFPKVKNVNFSIVVEVIATDQNLNPAEIRIIELFAVTDTGEVEDVMPFPEDFPYTDISIILDCHTNSFRFVIDELESAKYVDYDNNDDEGYDEDDWDYYDDDEEEDDDDDSFVESCNRCDETSHVLNILCEVAKSDFFYLYKNNLADSNSAYLANNGGLIVSTAQNLIDVPNCEVIKYSKKDISKIIDISRKLDCCTLNLITACDSYSFSGNSFKEFITQYEA